MKSVKKYRLPTTQVGVVPMVGVKVIATEGHCSGIQQFLKGNGGSGKNVGITNRWEEGI